MQRAHNCIKDGQNERHFVSVLSEWKYGNSDLPKGMGTLNLEGEMIPH